MTALLQQVQQYAAALPLSFQAELLNYAIYLEYKAHGQRSSIPAQERRECLAKTRRVRLMNEKPTKSNHYSIILPRQPALIIATY